MEQKKNSFTGLIQSRFWFGLSNFTRRLLPQHDTKTCLVGTVAGMV